MGKACSIEVVRDAVEFSGLPAVQLEPGVAVLSRDAPGFLAGANAESLKVRAMEHMVARPFHPQANGRLERYQHTRKREVKRAPVNFPRI